MKTSSTIIVSIVLSIVAALIAVRVMGVPNFGGYSIQTSGGGANPVSTLAVATTTPCAVPINGTSSIQHFALKITTGTSSAATVVVGTSTSAYATSSTPFATIVIPANAQFVYSWNAAVNNDVASPGTFLVAGMSNGSAVNYGYTYGGTCSVIINAI